MKKIPLLMIAKAAKIRFSIVFGFIPLLLIADTNDPIAQIRDEGMNRSQVMQTLSYLTDVIGPRLTGSPSHKRANEWTRDKLVSWGLTNAFLDAWPFGRGWSVRKFSAQIIEPQQIPLIAAPKAWTGGLDWPLVADVVYLSAQNKTDLDAYKGKLKGAVVLISRPREVKISFDPMATRRTDTDLLRLANATSGSRPGYPPNVRPSSTNNAAAELRARYGLTNNPSAGPKERVEKVVNRSMSPSTNAPSPVPAPPNPPSSRPVSSTDLMQFVVAEGAALIVSVSSMGEGGTIFLGAASVPPPEATSTNLPGPRGYQQPWSTNMPVVPPQVTVAAEDYNRMVRMLQQGQKLKMAVELQVQYHTNDLQGYNTIAQIPGSDLKKEIVMVGGHIDSWHIGTGATDNASGVAVAMEAVRILQALNLKPRRTIRVGLWGGEEQGHLGSRAYISEYLGYYTNAPQSTRQSPAPRVASPKDSAGAAKAAPTSRRRSSSSSGDSQRTLIQKSEYHRFSAYFNLDNGAGRIRGIYLQNNEAARPLFQKWLAPFQDLGANTISASNTGGTDHIPFDAIGLPGFQFIQDDLEYWTRCHHANMDVYDRIIPDDLKQASVIMASMIYNAAMADEKMPRKPVNLSSPRR